MLGPYHPPGRRSLRRAGGTAALLASLVVLLAPAGAGAATPGEPHRTAPPSAKLAAGLRASLEELPPGEMARVIVTLREQVDLAALEASLEAEGRPSRAERLRRVVRALQQKALQAQQGIRAELEAARAQGTVGEIDDFWIFNGLAVTATADVLARLAARRDVASIAADTTIDAPVVPAAAPAEANLAVVGAPDLWALGYTGAGVVVANMDTGVDLAHPDLGGRWRGGSNSWFDPNGQHPTTPVDLSGHGTWTMGVMVGGDAGGTSIGMAPGATWIAVKIFNDAGSASTSRIHQGFQWLLDPDGNPATADAPHVVNNSWTYSSAGCNLEFQGDLQALRAAGIVPVFAAGNSGPAGSTSRSPANNPEAFAVGATTDDDAIYSLSSRGPSSCADVDPTYPELVAPGVSIRTSDRFGGYFSATGTSLAAPHVAGALALLLDAHPGIDASTQETALEATAVDLGAAGPDSTFGFGRLDVRAAHAFLSGTVAPDFTIAAGPSTATARQGEQATYTVSVGPVGGFADDVALTVEGLPADAVATFTPQVVVGGTGSAELVVGAAASTPAGSYPLTVTGTAGALVHSAAVTLVVEAISTVTTAHPTATTILTGRPGGGSAASLAADDGSLYQVLSARNRSMWYGAFANVPRALTGLVIAYDGVNSAECTQTISIWRWTTRRWVDLDTRLVGPSGALISGLAPPGAPGDYVSGTGPAGELRVAVRCQARSGTFTAGGDLMEIAYTPA